MAESKDYIISSTEDGSVNISEDVITIIAWEAMREVDGFGGPAAGIPGDLAELIGRVVRRLDGDFRLGRLD